MEFLYDLKNKKSSELKKGVLSVLKFNNIEIKKLLKFRIPQVESRPSNHHEFTEKYAAKTKLV